MTKSSIIIFLPSVSIPEGGLKIRKNYKKLGMSSNPCSHDWQTVMQKNHVKALYQD